MPEVCKAKWFYFWFDCDYCYENWNHKFPRFGEIYDLELEFKTPVGQRCVVSECNCSSATDYLLLVMKGRREM
jgi:hypothetical protein